MTKGDFGTAIRTLRKLNKLTMQEFAESVGVKKSTVNMWENGGIVPREDVLLRISRKYNMALEDLLTNNLQKNPKLSFIQRGLSQMDEEQLSIAEEILKSHFKEIYDSEEENDGF